MGGNTPARDNPTFSAGFRWLTIADMKRGRNLFETTEQITDAGAAECSGRLVQPGTLVISFKLSLGKVGVVRTPLFTNEAIAALPIKDPSRITPEYLYHALRALDLSTQLRQGREGSDAQQGEAWGPGAARPPSIGEQRPTITAAILDKAETLRQKRQEEIRLSGPFIRSVFLDAFGDPVTNPKRWPVHPIGDMALVTTGNTPSRPQHEYYGERDGVPSSGTTSTRLNTSSRTPRSDSPPARRTVARTAEPGSTLMTCIAGSPDCIGNVALADRRVAFNQQINAITPGDLLNRDSSTPNCSSRKPLIQSVSRQTA